MRTVFRVPSGIDKNHAVFTALFLIFLALFLARVLPSLVPKEKANLEFLVSGLFLLISYPVVYALVGGAIDKTVEKEVEKEIDEYKKTQTSEGILEQQDIEYYAAILPVHRSYDLSRLRIHNDSALEEIRNDALACDEIVKKLGDEDALLIGIAGWACARELGIDKDSKAELESNKDWLRFRKDIFIYLKAWLILSVKYRRTMRVEDIKQRYPNEASPRKQSYLRVFRYIRDSLIDSSEVAECLDEKHYKRATNILKDYLTRLIRELERLNHSD